MPKWRDVVIAAVGIAVGFLIVYMTTKQPDKPKEYQYKFVGVLIRMSDKEPLVGSTWMRITPHPERQDQYNVLSWSRKRFDLPELEGKVAHFKTWFPVAPVPGDNGEDVIMFRYEEKEDE